MIFFLATEPHFRDHMRPLHASVASEYHDTSYHTDEEEMRRLFESLGSDQRFNSLAVVCSIGDYRKAQRICPRIILCEHGAGQSYSNRHPSYVGGQGRGSAVAFLVPNEQARDRSLKYYPLTPCHVVGCPKLDKWAGFRPKKNPRPLVVVSFHCDLFVTNETRSSFVEYANHLSTLKNNAEYDLAVHCHPRIRPKVEQWAAAHKVRFIREFEEVMQVADLYCIDNSSTLFEFAATDRPVVVLNSKLYRRHINHGLRFWDCAKVGVNCDTPEDLHTSILVALSDTPEQRALRQAITEKVYAVPLGQSLNAATDVILQTAERLKYMPDPDQIVLRAKNTCRGVFGSVNKGELIEVRGDHCYVIGTDGSKQKRPINMATTARSLARQCVQKGPYEFVAGDLKISTPEYSPRPKPKHIYAGRKKKATAPAHNKMAGPASENKGDAPVPPHLAFSKPEPEPEAAHGFASLKPIEQQLVLAQVSNNKPAAIAKVASDSGESKDAVGKAWNDLVTGGVLKFVPGHGYEITEGYAPAEGVGH